MEETTYNNVVGKGAHLRVGTFFRQSFIPLPLIPLFLFISVFFFWPLASVFTHSFQSNEGNFTFDNIKTLFQDPYKLAFTNSISIGLVSAAIGAVFGAITSYAIEVRGSDKLKKFISSISGVLANTGGVPLAFMFLAAFGPQGLITRLINLLGFDLYGNGFTLFSFTGLVIIYAYFQIPIMVIVFTPALSALRKEWREASANLGANPLAYWRHVGIPILLPSFISSFLLLFASGFSAFATARAMTVGNIALVPLQIGVLLDGNITVNQLNLGYALALGMIVISVLAMAPYLFIQTRTSRWQQ